jgi:hypothetical protein
MLSPWTILTPRLTCVSDGNPRRRLLIVSKGRLFIVIVALHDAPPLHEETGFRLRHKQKEGGSLAPLRNCLLISSQSDVYRFDSV